MDRHAATLAFAASLVVSSHAWAGVPPPPECTGPSGTVMVTVGVPYQAMFTGAGATDLTVSDTGSLPAGATLTPPSGTTAPEPFDVTLDWTPAPSQAGMSFPVVIEFIDEFGSVGPCELTFEVAPLASTTTSSSTTTTTVTTTTVTTTTVTTTTTIPECGNGVIEGAEECDPPNGEICNNLADDDGDFLVDCGDPDCEPLSQQSCGADCMLVEPCQPVEEDPAVIQFDAAGGLDMLSVHGRFRLISPMDPAAEGFGVALANAEGAVYRGELAAGRMVRANGRYRFRDRDVRRGEGDPSGLYNASVKVRRFAGVEYLVFKVRAYADLAAATLPRMTLVVTVGNDVGGLTADWKPTPKGWALRLRDFR